MGVAHFSRQEMGNDFDLCTPRKAEWENTNISAGKNLEGQLEWFKRGNVLVFVQNYVAHLAVLHSELNHRVYP